jgi:CSLREA domain-containing protein
VDTTADDNTVNGNCTLREAIIAANTDTPVDGCLAGAGTNSIFLPAGTFFLTIGGAGEDAAATGDLDILDELTITGDSGSTAINGNSIDRVFHNVGASLTLNDLHVTAGTSHRFPP